MQFEKLDCTYLARRHRERLFVYVDDDVFSFSNFLRIFCLTAKFDFDYGHRSLT